MTEGDHLETLAKPSPGLGRPVLCLAQDPGGGLARALARAGFAVKVFSAGAKDEHGPWSVVLLDQRAAGGEGLPLLAKLTGGPQPPAVVFLAEEGREEQAQKALAAGAHHCLVRDTNGGYVGPLLDILQSQIQDQESRDFRRMVEEAGQAVLLAAPGGILYANPRARILWGYSLAELAARPWPRLLHPDFRAELGSLAQDCAQGRRPPGQVEFRLQTKHGRSPWVRARLASLSWQGAPTLLAVLSEIDEDRQKLSELQESQRNLSARAAQRTAQLRIANQRLQHDMARSQEIEQALRQSEQRLRTLLEAAPVSILSFDRQGVVRFVNDYHLRVFSRGRVGKEAFLGKSVTSLPGIEAAGIGKNVAAILEGQTLHLQDVHFPVTVSGRSAYATLRGVPLTSGSQVTGGMLIIEDTTGRRRAEQAIRMLARFPDVNPNPVLRVSRQGQIEYANQAAGELLGLMGAKVGEALPAELWQRVAKACDEEGGELEGELDGRIFSLQVSPMEPGGPIYLWVQDITDRKQLQRNQEMTARVFESSSEGIAVADHEGKVQMVNPAYSVITGYRPEEVLGRPLNVFRSENIDPGFYEKMWASLTKRGQWSGEYWNHRKDGEAYPEWLTISIVKDSAGKPQSFIVVFHDITEIKQRQEKMRYQALHDPLTGLPNRTLFKDRLSQAMAHAERSSEWVGLIFMDLDDFKEVNDRLGHPVGDLLLKAVASRLRQAVRQGDTVARLGGDEFTIILPDLKTQADAVMMAQRVLGCFQEPFQVSGEDLRTAASLGITLYPTDAEDSAGLVRNADLAMYRAKARGGGRYQLYTPAFSQEASRRLNLERDLRRALQKSQFELHYQAQAELNQEEVICAEAMLRWQRPGQGLILPSEFLPLAEDCGLIIPIGQWALSAACRQAQAWRQGGRPGLRVAVNISPRQFAQENLARMVGQVLQESGLPARALELEIGEATLMHDVERAGQVLAELRDMGVWLTVDDFGTGYSSLYHLKRLPLQSLKIDRSLLRELPGDEGSAQIIKAVISMAHTLGLKVIAEGVESGAQLGFLKQHGCDQVQGRLFNRPLPAEAFGRILASKLPLEQAS